MTRARLRRRLVHVIYTGIMTLALLLIPLGASPVPVCHGWHHYAMAHPLSDLHGGAMSRDVRICRMPR